MVSEPLWNKSLMSNIEQKRNIKIVKKNSSLRVNNRIFESILD